MSRITILIDDGELIASDPSTIYATMDCAVDATVKAALVIAGERAVWHKVHQLLRCEVQDRDTRECRAFEVLLRVEAQ